MKAPKALFAAALTGAMMLAGTALAADKIKIGVSYPTPTHAWAAGMNWHAEKSRKTPRSPLS